MDENHKTYLKRIKGFIPKDRIYTDDLHCLAWGTDAGFYRNIPQVILFIKYFQVIITKCYLKKIIIS